MKTGTPYPVSMQALNSCSLIHFDHNPLRFELCLMKSSPASLEVCTSSFRIFGQNKKNPHDVMPRRCRSGGLKRCVVENYYACN